MGVLQISVLTGNGEKADEQIRINHRQSIEKDMEDI